MWIKVKYFQTTYLITLCVVLVILLSADFFIPKYLRKKTFVTFERKSSVYKKLFNLNSYVLRSKKEDKMNNSNLSLNGSSRSSDEIIKIRNFKTFHKIFRVWFQDHQLKAPSKLEFILKPANPCMSNGHNLSTLIAVTSKSSHFESRFAIRETWGSIARKMGAKVFFFLGQPPNSRHLKKVIEENNKFHDIIQALFLDTYANLTLKTIAMLKWVSEDCPLVRYVLKVDDDMFINVSNIMNVTRNHNNTMSILGELAHKWHPVRNKKSKYYASYQEYPFDIYPDFLFGPSYLISGDAIQSLYECSIRMNSFHLEDVYITGFVAEMQNISRVNLPAIFNTVRDLQPCQYKKLISSHGHTAHDIRRHWMWLSRKKFQCI